MPADDREHSRRSRGFEKIAEQREEIHFILRGLPFCGDQSNLPFQARDILELVFDVEHIYSNHVAFGSSGRRRTRPSHGIDLQPVMHGGKNLAFGGAARPATPDGVLLSVHIFQAEGFHFRHAPFFRLAVRRSACHAAADVVTQFR